MAVSCGVYEGCYVFGQLVGGHHRAAALVDVEVGEPVGEPTADLSLGAVPVGYGGFASGGDDGAEVVGQAHGGVATYDFVFYLIDGQVRQVTGTASAASHAQPVEVQRAVVALATPTPGGGRTGPEQDPR